MPKRKGGGNLWNARKKTFHSWEGVPQLGTNEFVTFSVCEFVSFSRKVLSKYLSSRQKTHSTNPGSWALSYPYLNQGDSYFDKVENLKFGMLPSCCILLTDFRTVFFFALGPFLPMWAIFLFNGNYNGKTAKNLFTAIKSSRSVLQPSSYHCWATFL